MKPLTQQTLFFLPRACFTRQSLNCCQVGILLRAERLSLRSRSGLACSCLQTSPLPPYLILSLPPPAFFFQNVIPLLTSKNKYTRTILSPLSPYVWCSASEVLACSASLSSLTAISQWRKNKRGGEWVRWVCSREIRELRNSSNWKGNGHDGVCVVRWRDRWKVWGSDLREWAGEECPLKVRRKTAGKHLKEIRGWWRQTYRPRGGKQMITGRGCSTESLLLE